MKLIVTLFPEDPASKRELDHLESLVRASVERGLQDQLTFWVGSAHHGALDAARAVFERARYPHWRVLPTNFQYDPVMDERRAHEISIGKQFLAKAWSALKWEWIGFYDADIEINLDHITRAGAEVRADHVVKFPYVVRDPDRSFCPPQQFGAFVQHGEVGDYSEIVYLLKKSGDKLCRDGAPDCNILRWMQLRGITISTAAWSRTCHWMSTTEYRQHWAGVTTQHRRLPGWGFDPAVGGQTLDIPAMQAIRQFLSGRPIRTALDLGTGVGNGLQLLMDCGAASITSVDQYEKWMEAGQRQASRHPRKDVQLITHLAELDADGSYRFDSRFAQPFDVVLVDGPCNNPAARIATVKKLTARCYIFHDWKRDRSLIKSFAASLDGYEQHSSTEGRGVFFAWKN